MKRKDPLIVGRNSVRDMHHLRLMALLQELVRTWGCTGTARVLEIDPRTVTSSMQSGQLTHRVRESLQRALQHGVGSAADRQRERSDKLEARMDKLEARMDKLEARMDKLEARMDKLEARMDKLEARMDKLEARMDKLEARMDKLEARMDKLEARMDKLEARMDKLEAQLKEMKENFRSGLKGLRMSLDGVRKYYGVQRRLIEQRLLILEAGRDGAETGAPTDDGSGGPGARSVAAGTGFPGKLTDPTLAELVDAGEPTNGVVEWGTSAPPGRSDEKADAPSEPGIPGPTRVSRRNLACSQEVKDHLSDVGVG